MTDRRYREDREVAEPVTGAFLSPRLCWSWRSLFSALGHPEAFRDHFVRWGRAFACPACPYPRLCSWDRHTPEHGWDAQWGFGDKLFEGLRST